MPNTPNPAKSVRTVSATEAAKNFGSILAEVRERAAEYVVEHRGKPVAQVVPVREPGLTVREFFEYLEKRSVPPAGEEYLRAVEEGIAIWNREEIPGGAWER